MNKQNIFLITLVGLLILLSFPVFSEEVKINLMLPQNKTMYSNSTLNANEDLIFYVCPGNDATDTKASLICKENYKFIELETHTWDETCEISKYNLEDIDCKNIQIQYEYKEKNQQIKITKDIRLAQNSEILGYVLNRQNSNGGFDQDALYTAYGVWVMSNYKSIYANEITGALDWLKFNRDEQNKCWPKNDCSITTTAQILYLLGEAGYSDELRIVKDAKIWVEKNQNYLSNSIWRLKLDASEVYVQDDAICNITHGGSKSSVNIKMNEIYETNLTVNNNENIEIDCTQEVHTSILDMFGAVVFSEDNKHINYHIGDACWGEEQFQTCKEYSNENFVKYEINFDAGREYLYTDLNVTVTNETKVTCSVQYGGQLASFTLPQNKTYDYSLLINQEDNIIIGCDYNVNVIIYDENHIPIESNTTKNVTYKIFNKCEVTDKYTTCDVKSTALAAASGINPDLKKMAREWMINTLRSDVVGQYAQSKDIFSNELFVISTDADDYEESESVVEWLAFNQNNDGSWGKSTRIKDNLLETVYGAMALSKFNISSSEEIVKDSKQWVWDYEPQDGWGDVEKNALAFWAVKEQIRPFLKTNPQIVQLNKDEIQINVINPTDFNIKDIEFEFTNDLDEIIEVEPIAEIFKKSYKRVVLKLKNKKEETNYGIMTIRNNEFELSRVPIITYRLPEIDFSIPSAITVYGDKSKIRATINYKTNGSFSCTTKWDNSLIDKGFTVDKEGHIDLVIETKEVKRQTRNVTGEIICNRNDHSIRKPISIMINQYTTKPFNVKPKSLISIETEKDITFTIENLIDKVITATITFDRTPGLYELDKRKISINPLDKENITIINLVPNDMNFTQDFDITVSALGQEEIIPFRVAITETRVKKTNFTNMYIILVLAFIFTSALGVVKLKGMTQDKKQYEKLREIVNKVRKNKNYQKYLAPLVERWLEKVFPIQIDETHSVKHITVDADMIVAVKFMKTIGKDETTIKEKLKSQGFNDAYITELLKKVTEN